MSYSMKTSINDDAPRLTVSWWFSDIAITSLAATSFGAVYGAFQPFPLPGSKERASYIKTGKLVPLPPFSSLASMCRYGGLWGSLAAVSRFAAGGMAVARNRQDLWNEFVGAMAVFGYAEWLFKSQKRVLWNNRAVAGVIVGSAVYANTAPERI